MNNTQVYEMKIEIIKALIVSFFSALFAFLEPVQNAVYLLLFLFVSNLLVGIFHDIIINNSKFKIKKFIWAAFEAMIYCSIICAVFVVGFLQSDGIEAQYVIKIISYLFCYAYGTNIFKNLVLIRPNNLVFNFIYYAISFAFIKKIPYLKDYINKQK